MNNFKILNQIDWESTLLSYNMQEEIHLQPERPMSSTSLKLISLINLSAYYQNNYRNIILSMSQIMTYIESKGGETKKLILNAFEQLKDAKYKLIKNGMKIDSYKYLSNYNYNKKTNTIEIELEEKLAKFLFDSDSINDPKKLFWLYTFGMKSKYGQQLYELIVLKEFKQSNKFSMLITSFKELFCIQNTYHNSNHLRKHVIIPAINDINKNTPYNLEYEIKNKIIHFSLSVKTSKEIEEINNTLQKNNEIKRIVDAFDLNIDDDEEYYDDKTSN